MDIVIFAPDLIEYAFVDVSLSEQTLWEESRGEWGQLQRVAVATLLIYPIRNELES